MKARRKVSTKQAVFAFAARSKQSAASRRDSVWRLLQDGAWHTTVEINAAECGGSEGCRRVRELRGACARGERPGTIEAKSGSGDTTQWLYRWVGVGLSLLSDKATTHDDCARLAY